ncbi:hypothetical protein D5281_20030 [bacterium 1xD42-62]|uniref:Uncharacterized protein n=2 Tax=Parablautia muri TaxID=2320879 RepID=A0A9X5BJH4_9FIRM|nr:hypothetical protein [Parablautia muri]
MFSAKFQFVGRLPNRNGVKKERDCMKKILLILSIIFILLTFVGAIYVLTSNGTANPGYAVIPMVIALTCLSGYRTYKNKEK